MTVEIGDRLGVPGITGRATLIRLTSPGGAEVTIYPAVGFNVFDWRAPGAAFSMLHAEPDVLAGGSGTRSGNPILFPFPNRIAGASFTWDGVRYRLPEWASDPGNAIHGFCAEAAWHEYRESGPAAVTGQFLLSRDAPADWPGDLSLEVTIDLSDLALTIVARVENRADVPAPFGLGYHPYFAPLGASRCDDVSLWCPAESAWELRNCIPTGAVVPVSGGRDLRAGPVIGTRVLDDVLTELPPFVPESDGLMERARITGGDATLAVRCDEAFRDIVVFTPPDRASLAVEPYTCPTDAVHLTESGREVGWRVLRPGASWTGTVQYTLDD